MNPNKVLELADHFCQQLEVNSEEYELWSQDILEKKKYRIYSLENVIFGSFYRQSEFVFR